MNKIKIFLWGFLGILLLSGLTQVFAAEMGTNIKMRSVSGEIKSIDIKTGKLQINSDLGQDTRGIMEYDINQVETRVTDPTDKKFIVIKDLQVGQRVTIKLIDKTGETMIRKIIAEPMPEPVFQEVVGELVALDTGAGTLVIQQQPIPEEEVKPNLTYFIFQPKSILVLNDSSMRPIPLKLNYGDLIKVGFVVKDGKQQARSITLLKSAPQTVSRTTTTTTRTTVTE